LVDSRFNLYSDGTKNLFNKRKSIQAGNNVKTVVLIPAKPPSPGFFEYLLFNLKILLELNCTTESLDDETLYLQDKTT